MNGEEMHLWLTALGLVLIIEGVPWFLSPQGFRSLLASLSETSETTLRWAGLGSMLLGLLLVYLGCG